MAAIENYLAGFNIVQKLGFVAFTVIALILITA